MKIQGNLQLLNGGELLAARIENLAADPITPYAGQVWFNTTTNVFKGYTGATIMQFATGGALADYLAKTGGTMTGALVLYGEPQADLEAATKKYVDDGLALKQPNITGAATTITATDLTVSKALVSDAAGKVAASTVSTAELEYLVGVTSGIQAQIDAQVAVAGDTMTGLLTLSGAPTADLHAATKKYVDDGLVLKENVITGAATSITQSNLTAERILVSDASGKVAASTTTMAEVGYLSGVTSAIQTQLDNQVLAAGDTMTGTLAMGENKITSSYVPDAANVLANKGYVDSAIAKMNWQADVKAVQTDATLDPGTAVLGDRYIITNSAALHSGFGTIAGLGDDDIIEFDGTAWYVAYDISAQGSLAEGTITWCTADHYFVRFYGDWIEFGGLNALNAGIGLIKNGNIVDVNLGAGIKELPSDEVGIDFHSAGALWLIDPVSGLASTATDAQLSIKLDAATLTATANGLKVSDAGITEAQLNTSVAGGGLVGGAGTALAVNPGDGISIVDDKVTVDTTWGDARYINTSGDTMTGTLTLAADPVNTLEAATKGYVDTEISDLNTALTTVITTLSNRVDAGYFLYTSSTDATTHTVTHNMNRQFVNVTVVDANNQVVLPQSITFDSANALTVVFNSSINCKVVVGGVQPPAA